MWRDIQSITQLHLISLYSVYNMSKVIQCVYLCSVPWDALSQGPSFDVVVGMLSTALAGWRAVSFGTWAVPAPGQFRHPERPKVDAFWGKISGGNRRFQYAQTSGFEYFFKQGQNKWGPCFGGVGYRYRHLEPLPERYPSKKDLRKRHKPIRPPAVLFCQMDAINYLQLSSPLKFHRRGWTPAFCTTKRFFSIKWEAFSRYEDLFSTKSMASM